MTTTTRYIPKISLEVLGDFANKSLEGQLADKQVGALLVLADFTKSDSSRTETVRLLHTTSGVCGLNDREE